jgi:hypothetical protein
MSDLHDDHDVDWNRTRVHSRAQQQDPESQTGLGDPTRWGSEASLVVNGYNSVVWSSQLLRVQSDDAYPRNWQMIGSVETATATLLDPLADLRWIAILEVLLGVGQAVVRHQLNLRALLNLACDPTQILTGLNWYYPAGLIDNAPRPAGAWVLPAALVARSLSARVGIAVISGEGTPLTLPQSFSVTATLSPYAPGHNL